MIDAQSLADNSTWVVAGGLTLVVVAWFWDQFRELREYKQGKLARPSPFHIQERPILELESVQDEAGKGATGVCSVNIYLVVSMDEKREEAISNVVARMNGWMDAPVQLPERGRRLDEANLRHGEHLLFCLGSVLVPTPDSSLPKIHMFSREKRRVEQALIENLIMNTTPYRKLEMNSPSGHGYALAQIENQGRLAFSVTITADNVRSATSWFRLNLFDEDSANWFEPLAGEPDEPVIYG